MKRRNFMAGVLATATAPALEMMPNTEMGGLPAPYELTGYGRVEIVPCAGGWDLAKGVKADMKFSAHFRNG